MGQEIPYRHFTKNDVLHFKQRLKEETEQLQTLFDRNQFAHGHSVGGLELEAWLVDSNALPMAKNVEFLQRLNHPEVVPELSLFNIELNVEPQVLKQRALSAIYHNLKSNWAQCRTTAASMGLDVMAIGTHPSLLDSQLTLENMSSSQRYKVLNEQILALRKQAPIKLDIQGREPLCSVHNDVMLEAATTSFQIHFQTTLEHAVADFNASQILSAPLVALSANSPYVFGVDLWDESRIPIFEQAIDLGGSKAKRVCFGDRYVRDSLIECFNKNLNTFEPLIPMIFNDPSAFLPHLRLHNGTVWRWNRPIVAQDGDEPHLRIENRVVPAGPSLLDMIANAAFYWGGVVYLRSRVEQVESKLNYAVMKHNFYAAVKNSLSSHLFWLDGKSYPCDELILNHLLPGAYRGLEELGVDKAEIDFWLNIIRQRVETKQNGAMWQRAWVAQHGRDMQALAQAYLKEQNSDKPIHEWSI